jgi:hypothetical protein
MKRTVIPGAFHEFWSDSLLLARALSFPDVVRFKEVSTASGLAHESDGSPGAIARGEEERRRQPAGARSRGSNAEAGGPALFRGSCGHEAEHHAV